MTTFVSDTFTDTDGTFLTSHTGEVGATWAFNSATSVDNCTISSGELYSGSSDIMCYASGTPSSPDYDVSGDHHFVTGATGIFVCGRMSQTVATFYGLRFDGSTTWELYKRVTGTFTLLGSWVDGGMTAGVTKNGKLSMTGSSISGLISGVSQITASDASITLAGNAGIRSSSSESGSVGVHLDNFLAADAGVVAAPPPVVPTRIPNRNVGPMALRNLYRTATPTAPTADASQLPITIGAPPAPLKLPNPYVGPMALRQVTKLPPPPLPSIGVTDSVGFATTGSSAPSFTVTDTASPTVVLPFRIPNRNVGPMALRQAYRQPGFQSVNTAGGVTQTFGFNTTGSSAPAFTLAGMTDTFVVATTGHSAPVFTLAGMSDVFVLSTTGKSTPAFVLAGMTDVFVVSSTGVSTPAFTVVSIPAGGSTDVFSFSATGSSTTRFGLIFFSLNREGDRVSREAGLGLGSMYEYANYTTATSASAAEHSRVNAGVGLGAGSHIDFTNAAAKTDEATTEGNRVKDLAGIGGGSQANL